MNSSTKKSSHQGKAAQETKRTAFVARKEEPLSKALRQTCQKLCKRLKTTSQLSDTLCSFLKSSYISPMGDICVKVRTDGVIKKRLAVDAEKKGRGKGRTTQYECLRALVDAGILTRHIVKATKLGADELRNATLYSVYTFHRQVVEKLVEDQTPVLRKYNVKSVKNNDDVRTLDSDDVTKGSFLEKTFKLPIPSQNKSNDEAVQIGSPLRYEAATQEQDLRPWQVKRFGDKLGNLIISLSKRIGKYKLKGHASTYTDDQLQDIKNTLEQYKQVISTTYVKFGDLQIWLDTINSVIEERKQAKERSISKSRFGKFCEPVRHLFALWRTGQAKSFDIGALMYHHLRAGIKVPDMMIFNAGRLIDLESGCKNEYMPKPQYKIFCRSLGERLLHEKSLNLKWDLSHE